MSFALQGLLRHHDISLGTRHGLFIFPRTMQMAKFYPPLVTLAIVLSGFDRCNGFTAPIARQSLLDSSKSKIPLRMKFLQDLVKDAFDNDPSISQSDPRKGQLEGPNSREKKFTPLTDVQRAWRDKEKNQRFFTGKGAPIGDDQLVNSKWNLDLFLAGVPSKDPSNDLYGSKTNISSRDRQLGLDIPADPTISVELVLLDDKKCKVSETPFTSGQNLGEWKLSEDGTTLRFSIDVMGYCRTVQTTGTIQRVFWSDEAEVSRQTSTEYNIPAGWLYGDISVGYGSSPGTLATTGDGVLRVEQKMGLLGAASKMIACGKFTARSLVDVEETANVEETADVEATKQSKVI